MLSKARSSGSRPRRQRARPGLLSRLTAAAKLVGVDPLWASGFLPGEHAGCSFRSAGDPILFINNPAGVPAEVRRTTLDGLAALNQRTLEQLGDQIGRAHV